MPADELGEFERIRRYFAPLAGPGGLGLADDAALVDCAPGKRLVITADAIVAGVHYLTDDPPDSFSLAVAVACGCPEAHTSRVPEATATTA